MTNDFLLRVSSVLSSPDALSPALSAFLSERADDFADCNVRIAGSVLKAVNEYVDLPLNTSVSDEFGRAWRFSSWRLLLVRNGGPDQRLVVTQWPVWGYSWTISPVQPGEIVMHVHETPRPLITGVDAFRILATGPSPCDPVRIDYIILGSGVQL